jgi:hypothetical protein
LINIIAINWFIEQASNIRSQSFFFYAGLRSVKALVAQSRLVAFLIIPI